MNYREFVEWDRDRLYTEYMSVKEAKEEGLIPSKFSNVILDNCECGSENIIQTNLKRMKCCDPLCRIKMGMAMSHMFSNFEVKDLGNETCKSFVDYCMANNLFSIPSHVEILGVNLDSRFSAYFGNKAVVLANAITYIKHRRLTFGSMVSKLAIPMFDSSAEKIFEGVSGVEEFIDLVKFGNNFNTFMVNRGVKDLIKIDSLRKSLGAILYFENLLEVDLVKPGKVLKSISITGSVKADGNRLTRAGFVTYCNLLGNVNGVQLFTVKENKALSTNEYIVADSPSSSEKYTVGRNREMRENRKIIVTAQEYVDLLREEIEECKERARMTLTST